MAEDKTEGASFAHEGEPQKTEPDNEKGSASGGEVRPLPPSPKVERPAPRPLCPMTFLAAGIRRPPLKVNPGCVHRNIGGFKNAYVILAWILGIELIHRTVFKVKLEAIGALIGNPAAFLRQNNSWRLRVRVIGQKDRGPTLALDGNVVEVENQVGKFFIEYPGLDLARGLAHAYVIL
jgi:hypothetical protein